jgi:hypothetical protein
MIYRIELDEEDDGRVITDVPELPGVLVYGKDRQDALLKAQALALRVIAERVEMGQQPNAMRDECPDTVKNDTHRARLDSGYAYRLDGSSLAGVPVSWWRHAPDDEWVNVIIDPLEGELLGQRRIDGSRCTVVRVDGRIYAQLSTHVTVISPS